MVTHSRTPIRIDRLRALNVPQPIEVALDARGLPAVIRPRQGAESQVETIVETWRVDDEWWRHLISRRYVEVLLVGGKHVVLYQDLTTNQWFMQQP